MSELNMQQVGFCLLVIAALLWLVAAFFLALIGPNDKTRTLFWKGTNYWAVVGILLSLSPLIYEKL